MTQIRQPKDFKFITELPPLPGNPSTGYRLCFVDNETLVVVCSDDRGPEIINLSKLGRDSL